MGIVTDSNHCSTVFELIIDNSLKSFNFSIYLDE